MKTQSPDRTFLFRAMTLLATAMTTAAAAESEKQFKVSATAPATNYSISISGVYQVKEEIWVISRVAQVGDFGGQALTTVSDTVKVNTSDLPGEKFKTIHKISGRAIKGGGSGRPDIRELQKRIAKMKSFAARARFTPEAHREYLSKLAALERQLEKLEVGEDKKNGVDYISKTGQAQLEKTLEKAKKIPFVRAGKETTRARADKKR
jgi:hypothetical protein